MHELLIVLQNGKLSRAFFSENNIISTLKANDQLKIKELFSDNKFQECQKQ